MTEKRFTLFDDGETIFDNESVADDGGKQTYWTVEYGQMMKLVDLLNALHEEKEDWKHNCLNADSENSILWNEINIMREQGAEPSTAFQKYLDSISTEYEKFWNRKKEKARKDNVIK